MHLMILSLFFLLSQIECRQIHQLSYKNYSDFKKSNKPLLVLYINDDRKSQKFLPDFRKLADDEQIDKSIKFALVDASREKKLIEKTQISDFPTTYFFIEEQEKQKYQGIYHIDTYKKWIQKVFKQKFQQGKYLPCQELSTTLQLRNKFSLLEISVVLFTQQTSEELLLNYQKLAKQFKDKLHFFYIHNFEVGQEFNVTEDRLFINSKLEDTDGGILRQDQLNLIYYEKSLDDFKAIQTFLGVHSIKSFLYVDGSKYNTFPRENDIPLIALVYNKSVEEQVALAEKFKENRYQLYKKAVVGILDINRDGKDYIRQDYFTNFEITKEPFLVAIKGKGDGLNYYRYNITYPPDEDFVAVRVYNDLQAGLLKPIFKIQQLTREKNDHGVQLLNGENYYEFMKKQKELKNDVVIMWHAEDCGNCRKFYPIFYGVYDKVIQINYNILIKLKNQDDNKIIFAQLDLASNELDFNTPRKFPTIILYPWDGKKEIQAVSLNTERNFIAFLRENSVNPVLIKEDL